MVIILFDCHEDQRYYSNFSRKMESLTESRFNMNWPSHSGIWEHLTQTELLAFKTWDNVEFNSEDKYFYYINCRTTFDICSTYAMDFLSSDRVKLIADNNVNVWYDFSYEMCLRGFWFPKMYTDRYWQWKFNHINPNYTGKLIISILNAGTLSKIEAACHRVNYIDFPFLLWNTRAEFNLTNKFNDIDKLYLHGDKKYLFLNLNRTGVRKNRILFMHGLKATNLLQHGLVSMRNPVNSCLDPYKEKGIDNLDYFYLQEFIDSVQNEQTLPTMILDDDPVNIETGFNWTYSTKWSENVCFDIVSETVDTVDDDEEGFLTEKTFKTILTGKPFIINGNKGTLAILRDYGFKTFPYLFDESYDEKTNYYERLNIILNNISRWKNDYNEFMRVVLDHYEDIEYNRQLLLNFSIEDHLVNQLNKF